MHQEGLQRAEVIGLEYGIERQTTKDIHLCLMAFQLFCGRLKFIWLFALPLFQETGGQAGGGGGGVRQTLLAPAGWVGAAPAGVRALGWGF